MKILNESLVCSCRFKDNILIFSESGDNYNYYDIARNTAIDVGNFVCWLPDSLSFFEDQAVLTNVNIINQPSNNTSTASNIILKSFSKEASDSLEDRCIVCFELFVNKIALVPCGHTQISEKCTLKVDNTCLLCRQKFTSVMKIYLH